MRELEGESGIIPLWPFGPNGNRAKDWKRLLQEDEVDTMPNMFEGAKWRFTNLGGKSDR